MSTVLHDEQYLELRTAPREADYSVAASFQKVNADEVKKNVENELAALTDQVEETVQQLSHAASLSMPDAISTLV